MPANWRLIMTLLNFIKRLLIGLFIGAVFAVPLAFIAPIFGVGGVLLGLCFAFETEYL